MVILILPCTEKFAMIWGDGLFASLSKEISSDRWQHHPGHSISPNICTLPNRVPCHNPGRCCCCHGDGVPCPVQLWSSTQRIQVNNFLFGIDVKLQLMREAGVIHSLRTVSALEATHLTSVDFDFFIYKGEILKPGSNVCWKIKFSYACEITKDGAWRIGGSYWMLVFFFLSFLLVSMR